MKQPTPASPARRGSARTATLLLGILVGLNQPDPARAAEEFQNWHGFNWRIHQTTNFDASAYGEVRYRDDASQLFQSLVSPRLTWKVLPNLDLGLNYTWFANRTKTGEFADTHRLEVEVNPHVKITDWLEFHNRNRLEIYWADGVNGERYRSRDRLQFTVPLKGFAPLESIFCNNEFWYEFYRSDYTANRAVPVGLNFHVTGHTHVAVFYMIQSSKQLTGHWDQAHILGTTLSF